MYLSLPLYNHKGFDVGHTWMIRWFSLLSSIKPEFCNKELMIWATISSKSCFCWLYRASSSLAAKNIISLISVLTVWWFVFVLFCLSPVNFRISKTVENACWLCRRFVQDSCFTPHNFKISIYCNLFYILND